MPRFLLPAAFALLASSVQAADFDLSAGVSKTIGWRTTAVAFFDASGEAHEWLGLHWQPTGTIGWIGSRSDENDHLDKDVFVAGGGFRLVDWWGGAFFGFEGGFVNETTDALSSHGQFISSLGWRGNRIVVMVRHISNGHVFGGRNLGETMVVAGVTF